MGSNRGEEKSRDERQFFFSSLRLLCCITWSVISDGFEVVLYIYKSLRVVGK